MLVVVWRVDIMSTREAYCGKYTVPSFAIDGHIIEKLKSMDPGDPIMFRGQHPNGLKHISKSHGFGGLGFWTDDTG